MGRSETSAAGVVKVPVIDTHWVKITIQADTDAIERVTGPSGDEWRAHMYADMTEREDVLTHWAWNAVHNGVTDASQLDGWADLEPGVVVMELGYE